MQLLAHFLVEKSGKEFFEADKSKLNAWHSQNCLLYFLVNYMQYVLILKSSITEQIKSMLFAGPGLAKTQP